MQCANCTSTVIDQKDGISLLSRVSMSASIGDDPEEESQERVSVSEALADMFGQYEAIGNFLADIDSEKKVPVLCSVCFDFVHRSHEARRGFLFKCEKDGLINSLFSLGIKEERIEDGELEIDDGSHRSVDGVSEDIDEPNSDVNVKADQKLQVLCYAEEDNETRLKQLKIKFGLQDCRVLLTRLDQVSVKMEVEVDSDSILGDNEDEDCDFCDSSENQGSGIVDMHFGRASEESETEIYDDYGTKLHTEELLKSSAIQAQATTELDNDNVHDERGGDCSSTRTLRQKYKCNDCGKIFANAIRLEAHTLEHDHEKDQEDKVDDFSVSSDSDSYDSFSESEYSEFEDEFDEQSDVGSGINEELNGDDQNEQEFSPHKWLRRKYPKLFEFEPDLNRGPDSVSLRLYKCKAPDCKFACPDADALEMHVKELHLNTNGDVLGKNACLCDGCGFVARNLSTLTYHKKSCKENEGLFYTEATRRKKHFCKVEDCRETFSYAAQLFVHTSINHHEDEIHFRKESKSHKKPCYRCCKAKCKFRCYSLRFMTAHMFEHTKEIPRFNCLFRTCKFVAATIENMTEHWRSHKDTMGESNLRPQFNATNVYTCRKCGQVFRELTVLRRHIARHGIHQWKCSFENCGRIFKFQKGLKKHESQHDPSDTRMTVDNTNDVGIVGNAATEINNPIVCDIWTWYQEGKLIFLQKFQCSKCSKTFRFKASLLSHIRDDHSDDLGICPLRNCAFRGYRSKVFMQHVISYTKELIYTCQICDHGTRDIERLKLHRKARHSHLPDISDSDIVKDVIADNTLTVGPQSSEIKRYLYCGIAHCDFRCETEEEWETHKNCGRELYSCSNATSGCKFIACSEEAKKRHEQLQHSPPGTIFCKAPHCTFLCETEEVLETHVEKMHPFEMVIGANPTLCDLCGQIIESESRLRLHKIFCEPRVSMEKGYVYVQVEGTQTFSCNMCPDQFSCKGFLRAHKIMKHDTDNRHVVSNEGCMIYKCDQRRCGFQGSENDLNDHCFIHTGEKRFKCAVTDCNYVTSSLAVIINHRQRRHAVRPQIDSSIDRPMTSEQSRNEVGGSSTNNAKTIYTGKQLQCKVCGKTLSSAKLLRRHVGKQHPNCEFLRFLEKKLIKKKSHSVNALYERIPPTESFSCEKCSKKFDYKGRFLVHSWIDHPSDPTETERNEPKSKTMFSCGLCKYACTCKERLKQHVLKMHTMEMQFRCKKPDCGYECVDVMRIKKHVKIKNPNHKTNQRNAIPQRKLQCDVCQKFFIGDEILRRHVANKHNDVERPFKCTQCPFATAYACSLRTHIKFKHQTPDDNLELFSCKLCTFSTVWKGALEYHMKDYHGGESSTTKQSRRSDASKRQTKRKGRKPKKPPSSNEDSESESDISNDVDD